MYFPKAQHQLPEAKTNFANNEEKGAYVNSVLDVVNKATALGDQNWNSYCFKEAQPEYVVASEGILSLMRITQDDPNFHNWLKQRIVYTMDRVSTHLRC